ncbi:hypothetical protein BGC30_06410 [Novacetimonas hansenii]|nr:hypothetical protein BGC30_06410 [Novacetimonas hansenii]
MFQERRHLFRVAAFVIMRMLIPSEPGGTGGGGSLHATLFARACLGKVRKKRFYPLILRIVLIYGDADSRQ